MLRGDALKHSELVMLRGDVLHKDEMAMLQGQTSQTNNAWGDVTGQHSRGMHFSRRNFAQLDVTVGDSIIAGEDDVG